MNDFTKEELAVIHLAIIRDMDQFARILKTSPSMLALRDKIESMLDNYCEHEDDGLIYHQWFGNEKYNCKYCIKCRTYYR